MYLTSIAELQPQDMPNPTLQHPMAQVNYNNSFELPSTLSSIQSNNSFVPQAIQPPPQKQTLLSSPIYVDMNKIVLYTPDAPPKARLSKNPKE